MKNTKDVRINELEILITKYQDAYYNSDPLISDAEFDILWDELKLLDPRNTVLHRVGKDSSDFGISTGGNFEKAQHVMMMGSQDKAANPEEFIDWARKRECTEFIVEYKLDGASLELQYENGILTKAVTRGDGVVGDDITRNVLKMTGAVPKLVQKGAAGDLFAQDEVLFLSGAVRGEVIMTHEVHSEHFSDKANCRNAANGLMKRKDGVGCEYLRIICYDAYFPQNTPFSDEVEKMQWLSGMGFETSPYELCDSVQSVIDYRAKVMEKRDSLSYDIDGLVIKSKEIDLEDASRTRPEKQIAFKFSLEEAVSILRSVIWSESGATYTPIGDFDAVELAGTTVKRASLNNPNMIRSLNLRIGSHVVVTKRGEIIPKIESLISNPQDSSAIVWPEVCGTCNTLLIDEGTRLYCPNSNCPKRIHHRLEKWITVLDVRDFGVNLIKRLFESGRLRSIADFYTLTQSELENLDRMGERSAKKVLASLDSRREISLSQLCAGFDIEGLGETLFDKLVASGFDTLEKLLQAEEQDIANVHGFGDITAKTLVNGFLECAPQMKDLLEKGYIKIKKVVSSEFIGKSFCFTGELKTMKRADAEKIAKDKGAVIKSSVTKDLTYLVTNDKMSGSSKNIKANALGIKIIDEQEFLHLIGG